MRGTLHLRFVSHRLAEGTLARHLQSILPCSSRLLAEKVRVNGGDGCGDGRRPLRAPRGWRGVHGRRVQCHVDVRPSRRRRYQIRYLCSRRGDLGAVSLEDRYGRGFTQVEVSQGPTCTSPLRRGRSRPRRHALRLRAPLVAARHAQSVHEEAERLVMRVRSHPLAPGRPCCLAE